MFKCSQRGPTQECLNTSEQGPTLLLERCAVTRRHQVKQRRLV